MKDGDVARAALSIWFQDTIDQAHAITYAKAQGYGNGSGSAPVKVTRYPNNVWTIETVSGESGGGIAKLWGGGAGGVTFSMPISLEIAALD
jgi:hypothetical protein